MANTNLTFAGNSLQTANILTGQIDHYTIPNKDIKIFALAHANASTIPFTSYPNRTVRVTGRLVHTTVANLDALIDTFRAYFINQDQNLDIDYNGGTRRYIATVNTLSIDRPGNLLYANFTLEFICANPFGLDTSNTTVVSASGRTLSTYNDNHTFLGSAPYQLPVITYTLTAVTGGTNQYIQFGNGGNGQAIGILRTWTAGDVVVIDCVNKAVTVNGVATNFAGAFPEFPPGAQVMQYSDGFTTRTFTVSAVYAARWL